MGVVAPQRLATSSLGLPPPVRMGEELDFGCAVGFGAAAVERRKNLEPKWGIRRRQNEQGSVGGVG